MIGISQADLHNPTLAFSPILVLKKAERKTNKNESVLLLTI